jgi:hypothetical protein
MSGVRITGAARAGLIAALLCAAGSVARGQDVPPAYPEFRFDAILGNVPTLQLGGGVVAPLGYYARLGVLVGAGVSRFGSDYTGGERADVLIRFLLDPFRETRWGISAGGGVSLRFDRGDGTARPYLVVAIDFEGPRRDGMSPAVQVGLGGGARIGIALRRSRGQAR